MACPHISALASLWLIGFMSTRVSALPARAQAAALLVEIAESVVALEKQDAAAAATANQSRDARLQLVQADSLSKVPRTGPGRASIARVAARARWYHSPSAARSSQQAPFFLWPMFLLLPLR